MWGWVILVGVVLAAVAGQLWKVHGRRKPVEPITEMSDLRQTKAQIDAVVERPIRVETELKTKGHRLWP